MDYLRPDQADPLHCFIDISRELANRARKVSLDGTVPFHRRLVYRRLQAQAANIFFSLKAVESPKAVSRRPEVWEQYFCDYYGYYPDASFLPLTKVPSQAEVRNPKGL